MSGIGDKRRNRLKDIDEEMEALRARLREMRPMLPQEPPPSWPLPPPRVPPAPENPAGPAGVREEPARRERFASYYMSGDLARSAPQLRRERRAQRNRAILMAVLAVLVLIAAVYYAIRNV